MGFLALGDLYPELAELGRSLSDLAELNPIGAPYPELALFTRFGEP